MEVINLLLIASGAYCISGFTHSLFLKIAKNRFLTLMLLVTNLADTKCCKKKEMTETLANGYSYESTQQELSSEYPHDLVRMISITFCIVVNWTKITSVSEGLTH